METLAGIGALAILIGIIRIIDWLFFQEKRERNFRVDKEKRILQMDKEKRIKEEKERACYREAESFVLHLLNQGYDKLEVYYKLSVRYNFLDAAQKNSLIDSIIIRNKKDSL